MSTSCSICDNFNGHNQDAHFNHYEDEIYELKARIKALEDKLTEGES